MATHEILNYTLLGSLCLCARVRKSAPVYTQFATAHNYFNACFLSLLHYIKVEVEYTRGAI